MQPTKKLKEFKEEFKEVELKKEELKQEFKEEFKEEELKKKEEFEKVKTIFANSKKRLEATDVIGALKTVAIWYFDRNYMDDHIKINIVYEIMEFIPLEYITDVNLLWGIIRCVNLISVSKGTSLINSEHFIKYALNPNDMDIHIDYILKYYHKLIPKVQKIIYDYSNDYFTNGVVELQFKDDNKMLMKTLILNRKCKNGEQLILTNSEGIKYIEIPFDSYCTSFFLKNENDSFCIKSINTLNIAIYLNIYDDYKFINLNYSDYYFKELNVIYESLKNLKDIWKIDGQLNEIRNTVINRIKNEPYYNRKDLPNLSKELANDILYLTKKLF